MLNNGGARFKRSKLEKQMNNEVVWCFVILIAMCLVSAIGSGLWQRTHTLNATLHSVPFIPPFDVKSLYNVLDSSAMWTGFTSFWTFIIIYQVIIPISLYVTIEVIKLMQIYHIHCDEHFKDSTGHGTIECRALNIPEELGQVQHVFTDKTGTLTENNMIFQRCSINGIDYNHKPISSGHGIENEAETFVVNQQLQESLEELSASSEPNSLADSSRLLNSSTEDAEKREDLRRIADFFFTLAACNTVVVSRRSHKVNASRFTAPSPQSSPNLSILDGAFYISHLPKLTNSKFHFSKNFAHNSKFCSRSLSPIASSPPMTPPATPDPASCEVPVVMVTKVNCSSENSGNVSIPGTDVCTSDEGRAERLTSVNSTCDSICKPNTLRLANSSSLQNVPTEVLLPPSADFFYLSPSFNASCKVKPCYEAESPDELALVDAAYKYGCPLISRNLHSVIVALPGRGICEYEILHVLPFDSHRKRMSVIVKDPFTGQKVLFCKGADSAILDNLSHCVDDKAKFRIFRTQQHLNAYAKKGLRVLCMAKRILKESEYTSWLQVHKDAEATLSSRELKLRNSYVKIEKELLLLGATGIEDRLQDYVPETISSLRQAGMVVWVLTGDKQETAINIAYACSLFTPDMEVIKINARTKNQAERAIKFYLAQIELQNNQWRAAMDTVEFSAVNTVIVNHVGHLDSLHRGPDGRPLPPKRMGLVVDGQTLVFILDERTLLKSPFFALTTHCSAVMCCRATPLQKAFIVKTAKEVLGVLTLAIGDGANDVSMIQTADVGVGISGLEGRQAVMASDYAITQFCHLQRLLIVHGHWCYDRLARIMLYFFYKNAFLVFLLMWYQLYCGFTASVMIDQMYLVVFHLLFTSLPSTIVGVYNKDAPETVLLSQPSLYSPGRLSKLYRPHSFWINILDAFYQSIIIFFFTAVVYEDSDAGIFEFGLTVCHACLVTQLMHISVETSSWTVLELGAIVLSLGIFYLFGIFHTVVCTVCVSPLSQFGELQHAVTSPEHWLSVFLTSVVAILPRFVIKAFRVLLCPTDVIMAKIAHQMKSQKKHSMTEQITRETSVSLSNA